MAQHTNYVVLVVFFKTTTVGVLLYVPRFNLELVRRMTAYEKKRFKIVH